MNLILLVVLFCTQAFADSMISVVGMAEKKLAPTHIQLRLDVWGKSGSAQQAQNLATQQFKNLKSQVEKFKVKKEDFRSEQYQLTPEYSYRNNESPQVTGYRSSQIVLVDFRKLEELGNFLDSLVGASKGSNGGVSIQGLQWDSDEKANIERELLAQAIKDGTLKAQEMARAADVKIKKLDFMSDSPAQVLNPEGPMGRAAFAAKSIMEQGDSAVEIAGGQIQVKVQVFMRFLIH